MDKEQWNQFIIQNHGSFLQSWQWAEFQKSLGRKIWLIEKPDLKGLVIKHDLPLNKNYLYCPRGPVGQGKIDDFLVEVKNISRAEKSIFFKIEPERFLQGTALRTRPFAKQRAHSKGRTFITKSAKEIQPSQTIILNISRSEDELLKQMHQKTRYNLRLAQKKGVVIERNNNQASLDFFLKLAEQTAQRDKFHFHSREYYQKMLEILGQEGIIRLFLAKYQEKVIAANLVCFFGQTSYYLHGASDYDFRNLMAP
ncbi:MAG: peptidoglycan bridge formation glycyltransferase FemA/FemB family protein, partial [Patescibacteria group bacterium]